MKDKGRIKGAWSCFLAAGLFLCNPIVGFLDVLPDSIGLVLICLGMLRIADLNDRLLSARRGFGKMLAVAVGQIFLAYFIFVILQRRTEEELNAYEHPMLLLLGSAVYAFFTVCFLIPAFRNLFSGLETAARFDGGVIAETHPRTQRSLCDGMIRRTTVFFILQSVLSVLPELTVLTSFENDAGNPLFRFDWYRYAPLFRLGAAVLALGLALWWLWGYFRLFASARRDTEWNGRLEQAYEREVLSNTALCDRRLYSAAFLLISLGILCSIRFKINDMTAIPSLLFALGVGGGAWLLREKIRIPHLLWWGLAGTSLVGILQAILNARYLKSHTPEKSQYVEAAYDAFLAIRIAELCEAILLLLSMLLLLRLLRNLTVEPTVFGLSVTDAADQRSAERRSRQLNTYLLALLALAILLGVGNAAYALFQLKLGWLWFVNLLLSLGCFAGFRAFGSEFLLQLAFAQKDRTDTNKPMP